MGAMYAFLWLKSSFSAFKHLLLSQMEMKEERAQERVEKYMKKGSKSIYVLLLKAGIGPKAGRLRGKIY